MAEKRPSRACWRHSENPSILLALTLTPTFYAWQFGWLEQREYIRSVPSALVQAAINGLKARGTVLDLENPQWSLRAMTDLTPREPLEFEPDDEDIDFPLDALPFME